MLWLFSVATTGIVKGGGDSEDKSNQPVADWDTLPPPFKKYIKSLIIFDIK